MRRKLAGDKIVLRGTPASSSLESGLESAQGRGACLAHKSHTAWALPEDSLRKTPKDSRFGSGQTQRPGRLPPPIYTQNYVFRSVPATQEEPWASLPVGLLCDRLGWEQLSPLPPAPAAPPCAPGLRSWSLCPPTVCPHRKCYPGTPGSAPAACHSQ